MQKITNKQLQEFVKSIAVAMEKQRKLCPKSMSGKHNFTKSEYSKKMTCDFCGMYKNH
jgi:hypothetical protein